MLQIELKINGCLIDFVDIINRSKQLKDRKSIYEVIYKGKKFGFTHARPEGAVVCAMKALQAIVNENPAMSEQEIVDTILER